MLNKSGLGTIVVDLAPNGEQVYGMVWKLGSTMADDRNSNTGLILAFLLVIVFVGVSYAIVHMVEACEIDPGFGDILSTIKHMVSTGGCRG